jgi:hypothetical protein
MTETDGYLFSALAVLVVFLYWSANRRMRLEMTKEKTLENASSHRGFESALVARQIQQLREDYVGAVRLHYHFSYTRKESIATARHAVSQLPFFQNLTPDTAPSAGRQSGEIASFKPGGK